MEKKEQQAKPEGYNKSIPGSEESKTYKKLEKPTVDELRESGATDTKATGQNV